MTSVSKDVYIHKLDKIINKYINTYHNTIKMKPVDVKDNTYIQFNKESNNKINLKLLILLEYQNAKIFLQKVTLSNWSEEVFVIKKVKNIVPWTYVISVLNGKEIVETFY